MKKNSKVRGIVALRAGITDVMTRAIIDGRMVDLKVSDKLNDNEYILRPDGNHTTLLFLEADLHWISSLDVNLV